MNSDSTQRPAAVNPFSPTAVAIVSDSPSESVSVNTEPITKAMQHVYAYLSTGPGGESATRNTLVIAGDYGTGKTHLAARILNHIQAAQLSEVDAEQQVRAVYLIATAPTFLWLYRTMIDRLPQEEVSSRVRAYYADIVASHLKDRWLADQTRTRMRNANIDAQNVTSELGLSDSDLSQELRQQLARVTMNDSFAIVLSLLLRPGFGDAAWQWLNGAQPDPLLIERGITSAIDDDASAVDAMGVLALLYSGQNRHFVLIIDELDKMLLTFPSGEIILAFGKLMTVFADARALLVLVGLTEIFDLLPDVRRFGYVVSMAPFDSNITREFIEKCQMAASGEAKLSPFTLESVSELVRVTAGNPRKIQLYCGQLFRMVTSGHGEQEHVTIDMVRNVARTHYTVPSEKELVDAVHRALGSQGWETFKDYYVSATKLHRVDLWVPMGTDSAGLAILVVDAVIESHDVDELKKRVDAIRTAVKDCETLLIVGGPVAPPNVPDLVHVFGREPLVYDAYSFSENLASVVKAMSHKFELTAGSDAIARVQKYVENISQQLANTQHALLQLTTSVRDLKSSSDQGFGLIRRELGDVARTFVARDEPSAVLPEVVNRLFEERLQSLEQLGTVATITQDAFVLGSSSESAVRDTMASIRSRLRDPGSIMQALGVVELLRKMTQEFRQAIVVWFRTYAPPSQTRLRPSDKIDLETLCLTYDAIYELLPLYELRDLTEMAEELDSRSVEPSQTTHGRVRKVRQQFEFLGANVQKMLLSFLR